MELCKRCITPLEEKLSAYLPKDSLPFRTNEGLCNVCYKLEKDLHFWDYFSKNNIFKQEFENFLNDRKKVIFAYSGGLDSTVVLDKLNKECKKRKIQLFCFTINHGFKGVRTLNNINEVIKFENLAKDHQLINITKEKLEGIDNVFDFYANSFKEGVLPCGANCNKIINFYYKQILDSFNESILITGGDAPVFNPSFSRYSILWEKQGFTVLRGGVAFGLNKIINKNYIIEKNIPWKDPGCGGYDTDCLLPGAVLKKIIENKPLLFEELIIRLPVILEYFSPRVRWSIINKEDALRKMQSLEVSDTFSYKEINDLVKK